MEYDYMCRGGSYISNLSKKPSRFHIAINNVKYKATSIRLIKRKDNGAE